MKLSKKDKMKIMEWAVELAKLEFQSQYNTLGSRSINNMIGLDELKRRDDEKLQKPDMNTVVASVYQSLIKLIED